MCEFSHVDSLLLCLLLFGLWLHADSLLINKIGTYLDICCRVVEVHSSGIGIDLSYLVAHVGIKVHASCIGIRRIKDIILIGWR